MYDLYRHTIQKKAASGDRDETETAMDESAGIEIVRQNYKQYTSWGPTEKIVRSFESLPSSPRFGDRKNTRKPKALGSLKAAEAWTDSE